MNIRVDHALVNEERYTHFSLLIVVAGWTDAMCDNHTTSNSLRKELWYVIGAQV